MTDPVMIAALSALVSILTSIVVTLLASWLKRGEERSKVQYSSKYPKAFESIVNLHEAYIQAMTLADDITVENAREVATEELFQDLSARIDELEKAYLRAVPSLKISAQIAVLEANNAFYETLRLVGVANISRKSDMPFPWTDNNSRQEGEAVQVLTPEEEFFRGVALKAQTYSSDHLLEKYNAVVKELTPLLNP
jgi:hypothetical protein